MMNQYKVRKYRLTFDNCTFLDVEFNGGLTDAISKYLHSEWHEAKDPFAGVHKRCNGVRLISSCSINTPGNLGDFLP
jgi:hypothetical protein